MKLLLLLISCLTISTYAQDFDNGSYEESCLINTPPVGWDGESTSAGVDCDYWYTGVNPGPSPDGGHFIRHQNAHIESIDQTVTGLDIGVSYEITAFIAAGTSGDFNIYVNDVLIATFPGGMPYEWHEVSADFIATGISANIKLEWNLVAGIADGALDGAAIVADCNPLTTTISSSEICLGDAFTLTSTSETDGTITWDGGVVNGEPFTPESSGTFTFYNSSTSPEDCLDSAVVLVHDLPEINAGTDQEICEGETLTLNGAGLDADGIYEWDGGVEDGVAFVPDVSATYTVTGTDENGCSNSDEMEVTVHALPDVVFTTLEDDIVCFNKDLVNLFGTPAGGSFSGTGVSGADFDPSAAGEGEHTLYYYYEDEFGCSATDSVQITVVDCLGIDSEELTDIHLAPNPFSDFTVIYFDNDVQSEHVVFIYDMLGQVVYQNELVSQSQLRIDKEYLTPGTYMLFVQNRGNEKSFTTKLIVQ